MSDELQIHPLQIAVPQAYVDGQRVHFVPAESTQPNAVPLLLTHGWPSTFADFAPVIGPLTEPAAHGAVNAPAFDVVVPSLPGYGFSGPPTTPAGTSPG